MNSHNDQENELKFREEELKKREQLLRLKEIEAEIHEKQKAQEPPFYPTKKENPPEGFLKRWGRKLANIAKFFGFIIATVVTIKIAYTLSLVIMVAGISWISYKIFLDKDISN